MKSKLTSSQKSTILAIFSGVGVAITGVVSAFCAQKALEKETKKEKAIAYIPAVGVGLATIGCIVGSTKFSAAEIATLTASCAAIGKSFENYRKAVHEKVTPEQEACINEVYYLNEITRLEQELEEREHPSDDDDWCTFFDSYSAYSFRAPYEQVEQGVAKALDMLDEQGYLSWGDIFYFVNDGDTLPSSSIIGGEYYDHGVGWSKAMLDEFFDGMDYHFDIFIEPVKNTQNAYVINYSSVPEPCYLEY